MPHADEAPFFAPDPLTPGIIDTAPKIGLAICYELSVSEPAVATFQGGAEIYLVSVAGTECDGQGSHPRPAGAAKEFGGPVLLASCVGTCDGAYCAGSSAVWNQRRERLAPLNDTSEGLLILDTDRDEAVAVDA